MSVHASQKENGEKTAGAAVREKNTQTRAAVNTAEVSLLWENPADNDQVRKTWSAGWQGWHSADWLSRTRWTVQWDKVNFHSISAKGDSPFSHPTSVLQQ